MTAPAPTPAQAQGAAATRTTVLIADACNDWRYHAAKLREGRMIVLWREGGRAKVLTKCGQVGELGVVSTAPYPCTACRAELNIARYAEHRVQREQREVAA